MKLAILRKHWLLFSFLVFPIIVPFSYILGSTLGLIPFSNTTAASFLTFCFILIWSFAATFTLYKIGYRNLIWGSAMAALIIVSWAVYTYTFSLLSFCGVSLDRCLAQSMSIQDGYWKADLNLECKKPQDEIGQPKNLEIKFLLSENYHLWGKTWKLQIENSNIQKGYFNPLTGVVVFSPKEGNPISMSILNSNKLSIWYQATGMRSECQLHGLATPLEKRD